MKRLKWLFLAAAAPFAIAAPAEGQSMQGMNMQGMNMPGMHHPAPAPPRRAARRPAPARPAAQRQAQRRSAARPARPAQRRAPVRRQAQPHAGHDMSSMPGMQAPATGAPADAQSHQGHDMSSMPGMNMPAQSATPPAGHDMQNMPGMQMPAQGTAPAHDMSQMPGMQMPAQSGATPAHDMSQMPGMQMPAGHDMSAMTPAGTDLPAGNAPPPPIPADRAADQAYPSMEMAHARRHLERMHGGGNFYQVMFNLAEYRVQSGRNSYHWDGEAWYGGDINRLWLKSEGEGAFGEGVERAEIQALFSHAIGPYFNLQGGLRYDFQPGPSRGYAALGVEGLAPGFFEVEGFLFLSQKGDLLARAEGYYDQRITQRLILQPRAEINFSAQDVPENRIGSGLSDAELGLRLRYDIRREFAPYVGVVYERAFSDTARFRRLAGEDAGGFRFVMGVRTWF